MNSFLTDYLNIKSTKISIYLNKYDFVRPEYITTFGILLNANALMCLLNNNFPQFVFLFLTGYFCSILDKTYIDKYNYDSPSIKYYQRVAEWLKIVSLFVIFYRLYKNNIDYMIITIFILLLSLCNINFVINDYNPKNKCIEFWKKCIIKIFNKDSLQYVSNFTKYFDESMTIIYLIVMMTYLFYKY
jgi:low temperature requirement protein LtrA